MRVNPIAIVAIAGFSAIVIVAIGALAYIAVVHDSTESQQIVNALTSIITVFTVVAGYVAKDIVGFFQANNVISTPTPTPGAAPAGSTPDAS